MNNLKVTLQSDLCAPGQKLAGKLTWSSVNESSHSVSIRLIWFTEGKGDRNYATVDSIDIPLGVASRGAKFEFVLPHRPLSFSGKIISLTWAVEAVVKPSNQSALAEFALANGGEPIKLTDKADQLKDFGIGKPFFSVSNSK